MAFHLKGSKPLRQRVIDILDDCSEMHDNDCASVIGPPDPFPCDCKRDEKVNKLVELAVHYMQDTYGP